MHVTIELCAPAYSPSDRRRDAQGRKAASAIARQLMVQMVQAGWRESEAVLSLADAFEDYCLYLAEHPPRLEPANSNAFSFPSQATGRPKQKADKEPAKFAVGVVTALLVSDGT